MTGNCLFSNFISNSRYYKFTKLDVEEKEANLFNEKGDREEWKGKILTFKDILQKKDLIAKNLYKLEINQSNLEEAL